MNITMIPLAELTPNSRNVRIHSAKQMEEYKRSVKQFGQTKAIVCDENKVILIGNGLYEAMKALGMTEAACFIKAGLTEHEKLKMMMADNKIYNLGVDNLEAIEGIIAELGELKDFDIPGYDPDLLETLTFAPIDADDFMGGYGLIDEGAKGEMQKASEKYAQEEADFAAAAEEITPKGPSSPLESPSTAFPHDPDVNAGLPEKAEETAGIALQRRFVVCPKCSEKIWL